MRKKVLLSLLVAAVMVLSGCALVVTDTDADNARTVLSVNGETINKGTMAQMVEYTVEQNTYYNNLYSQYFGYDAGYETDESAVLTSLIESYTSSMVEAQKAKELGFTELSEEDKAAVKTEAEKNYEDMLSQIETSYLTSSTNTGDALREEAIAYAEKNGYSTLDSITESLEKSKAVENLKADSVKDVTIDDTDIHAALDSKVESEKTSYESSLSAYGYAVNNGTATYYAPAGYRYVKQILIKFLADDQTAIDAANTALTSAKSALTTAQSDQTAAQTALDTANTSLTDAQAAVDGAAEDADLDALKQAVTDAQAAVDEATKTLAEKQTVLDDAQTAADKAQADYDAARTAGFKNIKAKADEAYEKALAGDDFDSLIETYNEDPGMQSDPGKTNGYAVCADYTYFDSAFTTAAMNLKQVGDVSVPTEGSYGYYIIRYQSDIAEGAKTLDEARDALSEETLTSKQDTYYNDLLTQWISEADVKSYPEKMGY